MRIRLFPPLAVVGLLTIGLGVGLSTGCTEKQAVPRGSSERAAADKAAPQAPSVAAVPKGDRLTIVYPLDETVFPPEIVEPTFRWRDGGPGADCWQVRIEFTDGKAPLEALCSTREWTPSPQQWREITSRTVESPASVTVTGRNKAKPARVLAFDTVRFSTSKDEVGAPLFFREVNLPFLKAVGDPAAYIRWRLGAISSRQPPPIVLERLPVCGNCHSFDRNGKTLAMEVDSGNEKGGYAIASITKEIVLDPATIIDWNDYHRDDGQPTFGLLCQISPDGKYVAGTVKDRALAVYRPDLMFSQLFFLIKGVLAIYDRRTKTIDTLPGADDPRYVQTNASWRPDGKEIVFARSHNEAFNPESLRTLRSVLVPQKEAEDFLEGGKTFPFDLYRIPFNEGRGGKAEPIPGASNNGMSNYFPKFSPDGKWIVFCKAKSFMLLQPDSELYIMPAEGGQARRLRCNTARMNSWHSWSPNGKWLVFSSKLNGPYTQLFLTHIDAEGNSTPPVVLDRFTAPQRAANIPEFVNMAPDAIHKITENFMDDHSNWRVAAAFVEDGDLKNGERFFRMALKLNPKSAEAHASLGVLLAQTDRPAEAKEHLAAALKLDPKNLQAHEGLGGSLLQEGQPAEALEHYRTVVELEPRNADTHNKLGRALAASGRIEEAIASFRQALAIKPNHADAHNNYGAALVRQGRWDEAIAEYAEAIRINPRLAEAYYNRGAAYGNMGHYDRVIVDCTEAIRINPQYAEAYYNRSVAYGKKKGNYDKVIADCTEAIRFNPQYAKAYYNRGATYGKRGDYDKAIADYAEVIRVDPQYAEAYCNRSVMYGAKGDYDKTIADCTEAIRINPQYAKAYYNRGVTYQKKGDNGKAEADFMQAKKLGIDAEQKANSQPRPSPQMRTPSNQTTR
jgi:tetratricopeptide (TPR) repeat protein